MNTEREDRLQRYLDNQMPLEERIAFEEELLTDPDLMAVVYDEIAVRDALMESSPARRIVALRSRRHRRKWAVPFLTVAAAASIAFLVFVLPRPVEHEVFRGNPATTPRALEPVGEIVAPPVRFVWTRDSGAVRYRLEIFNRDATRLHVATTADTFLVLDPGVTPPSTGYWKTTSLDSLGVGVQSSGRTEFNTP